MRKTPNQLLSLTPRHRHDLFVAHFFTEDGKSLCGKTFTTDEEWPIADERRMGCGNCRSIREGRLDKAHPLSCPGCGEKLIQRHPTWYVCINVDNCELTNLGFIRPEPFYNHHPKMKGLLYFERPSPPRPFPWKKQRRKS